MRFSCCIWVATHPLRVYQIWDSRVMGIYFPLASLPDLGFTSHGYLQPPSELIRSQIRESQVPTPQLRIYQIWDCRVTGTCSPLRVYQIQISV